jgi:hypothetical protein
VLRELSLRAGKMFNHAGLKARYYVLLFDLAEAWWWSSTFAPPDRATGQFEDNEGALKLHAYIGPTENPKVLFAGESCEP